VAVGGTSLVLNDDGSIAGQLTWNDNGVADSNGLGVGRPQGASGGGCSKTFAAPAWQAHAAGYAAAPCHGKRLAADVSAIADPMLGFDVFDTWGSGDSGWLTAGGTSLASSVIAGLFALAGGSGGTVDPAASVYENAKDHPSRVFDVVETASDEPSGTGFCGGASTSACGNDVSTDSGGATHNPNALGGGNVDCSFPRNTSDPAAPPPLSRECNTAPGYDGPSGVGTPLAAALFSPTSPAVSLRTTTVARLHKALAFSARATERLPKRHLTRVTFTWGDGHSSSGTTLHRTHAFTKKGRYDVAVVVTDSGGGQSRADLHLTVGERMAGRIVGTKVVRRGLQARFHVTARDPNTHATITKIRWDWGDHHSSKGRQASHTWHARGTYRVTATVTDNTGVHTTLVTHVRVD
jgi:hypothetical protein